MNIYLCPLKPIPVDFQRLRRLDNICHLRPKEAILLLQQRLFDDLLHVCNPIQQRMQCCLLGSRCQYCNSLMGYKLVLLLTLVVSLDFL